MSERTDDENQRPTAPLPLGCTGPTQMIATPPRDYPAMRCTALLSSQVMCMRDRWACPVDGAGLPHIWRRACPKEPRKRVASNGAQTVMLRRRRRRTRHSPDSRRR